jgi:hypothetical protein
VLLLLPSVGVVCSPSLRAAADQLFCNEYNPFISNYSDNNLGIGIGIVVL